MNNSLVSIIMAVHNGGHYLKGSVDCILNQDFKDFELLIIDDSSSDGAIDAVVARGDSRVRVHRNAVNIGQSASLQLGLSLAHGDLVARMDADDMPKPDWLSQQIKFMEGHPSCVVTSCLADVMDGQGHIYKRLRSPLKSFEIILKSLFSSPINHVGCVMRRQVVLAHGGYKKEFPIAADFDLWSRLLRVGMEIRTNPFVGVIVRAHPSSITAIHKGGADVPEICRILAENIKYFTSMDLSPDQLKKWWSFIYAPQNLSADDFIEMDRLLGMVYGRADYKRIGCEIEEVQSFLEGQRKIFFVKWLFACPSSSSRHVFEYFFKDYGFWSFYGLLWAITLGGRMAVFVFLFIILLEKYRCL